MIWRIEIKHKKGVFNSLAESIQRSIADLGLTTISKVEVARIYNIEGTLTAGDIQEICQRLLVDHVTQEYDFALQESTRPKVSKKYHTIEIAHNPGVMDPVENSTIKGIGDLGFDQVQSVRTAQKYLLYGSPTKKDLETVTNKILSNKLIQHVVDRSTTTIKLGAPVQADSFDLVLVWNKIRGKNCAVSRKLTA